MLLFLAIGGAVIATLFMMVRLFVPQRMHAGYDRGVSSIFLNTIRLGVIVMALCIGYLILAAYGIVK